jgi:hypothetical protein
MEQWILDQMLRGVGGRESDGDDEVRSGEPQQSQNQKLSGPASDKSLQHGDRSQKA